MAEYYFDIETYSPAERPDPSKDKIITVQYQRLSTRDGKPEGNLEILTEWDHGSEKEMLDKFRRVFMTGSDFDFIPVGMNLYGFDLIALLSRLNHHFNLNLGMDFHRSRPVIDIKSTLVMMNGGAFKGYHNIMGKTVSGSMIKTWYENKDYPEIMDYIKQEAENFVSKYQLLKSEITKVKL